MQTSETTKPRVLGDFEGVWNIARDVTHDDAPPAHFVGQGIWTHNSKGLAYREVGKLHMVGVAPMQAERNYQWEPDLSVYFDDGRFFHRVPALGGKTEHGCDPDHYKVAYDFSEWPRFDVTWHVSGPRKAYVMTSRFAPTPPGTAMPKQL